MRRTLERCINLNACFNTPQEEKEPLSIPGWGKPSGRSALVPGFMAGIQAAHDRFGKLPRKAVFEPAIDLAEKGFRVGGPLSGFLDSRRQVLSRLPETKRLFTKDDGSFFGLGDHFRQPELAKTLRQVVEHGAAYMYTGEWAKRFVAAVQKEGGKITLDDLKSYEAIWEEPVRTQYRNHEICVPGFSSKYGVALAEGVHLVEQVDLRKWEHYAKDPRSLFWLIQIARCSHLGFLPTETLQRLQKNGLDLSPQSRVKKETAKLIWKQMQDGKWPYAAKLQSTSDPPPAHSDGVVAVDRWGNVAAVTHTINTVTWGDTGIFVDGVSIPDSAKFQQQQILWTGPGKRLPDTMCPVVLLRAGKPILASSVLGGPLHERNLQILTAIVDFNVDPQAAVETPAFLYTSVLSDVPSVQVEKGQFSGTLLDQVRTLGQSINELSSEEAGKGSRAYWVGIHIDQKTGMRRGLGMRKPPVPSHAEGY